MDISKPFSWARGVCIEHSKRIRYGYIVYGRLAPFSNRICDLTPPRSMPSWHQVDGSTITFNTGFTDKLGADIFTGDYVFVDGTEFSHVALIYFDENEGAFYYRWQTGSDHINMRLTRERAAKCLVFSDIYHRIRGK